MTEKRLVRLPSVSIVIPVKSGMPIFNDVCQSLSEQNYDGEIEVICIDSGSKDDSIAVAKSYGYTVVQIKSSDFGHGKTRNYGASLSDSEFICFLTHDAIPADSMWLRNLVDPLIKDHSVAGSFSRHIAHLEADLYVHRELDDHFAGLFEHQIVEITNRNTYVNDIGMQQLYHFFSDNSSCLRRSVWEKYPFPNVQFAEDQIWAKTVVEAGYRKAYSPESVIYHSHSFGPWETIRRSFDESRAFHKLFGYRLCASKRELLRSVVFLMSTTLKIAYETNAWFKRPILSLGKLLNCVARPIGHYLGCKPNLSPNISQRLSRDDWIRSLK